MELNRIYNIDNVQGMRQMDAESVDLVVTSPPYDNLRNYNGFSFDLDGMIGELLRIVKTGGGNCVDSKRRNEGLFRKWNIVSASISVYGCRILLV